MLLCSISCCLLALGLSSCADDTPASNNTTTTKSYMPLASGNYWTYSRVVIDTNGTTGTDGVKDSTYVVDSLSMGGKGAFRTVTVRGDNPTNDTTYYSATTDGSMHMWLRYSIDEIKGAIKSLELPPNFQLPQGWLQISPASSSTSATWTAFSDSVKGAVVKYTPPGGSQLNLNADFFLKAEGSKGTTASVTIQGKQYTAQEYIVKYTLTVNAVGFGTVATLVTNQHLWFVENVGMQKNRTDNTTLLSPFGNVKVPGRESVIASFKVK